jgi:mRNA deadenylase 3'-5' endonuclease subunit Ccr4
MKPEPPNILQWMVIKKELIEKDLLNYKDPVMDLQEIKIEFDSEEEG